MKVLGVFRGFPGLGRVIGGVEILEALRQDYGCEVHAFTYFQGSNYVQQRGIEVLHDVPVQDVSPIGVLPTGHACAELSDWIEKFLPDLVVVDGEPLILHALRVRFPRLRIVALLNPADISNLDNYPFSMDYFREMYRHADCCIVHGLRELDPGELIGNAVSIPTIVRSEVAKIGRSPAKKIYCVLGGGTVNVDVAFMETTLALAKLAIFASRRLPEYGFEILCGCRSVAVEVAKLLQNDDKVIVRSDIASPSSIFPDAALVITRAGRNTLSELRLLGIPGIAVVSGCRFRKREQAQNAAELGAGFRCVESEVAPDVFFQLVDDMLKENSRGNTAHIKNGRDAALSIVVRMLGLGREDSEV